MRSPEKKAPKSKIEDVIRENPGWNNSAVSDRLRDRGFIRPPAKRVAAIRAAMDEGELAEASQAHAQVQQQIASKVTGGISLSSANVYAQRPQDRTKGLIFALPKGRGFPVKQLADEWHMSEDTVAKHAKRYGAFRYVESEPGEYTPCVLHPETAEKYKG